MKNLSAESVTSAFMDYLTCGRCLREFPLQKITTFIQHKKLDCEDGEEGQSTGEDPELQCSICPQGFMTAWGLLVHAQFTHNLRIFLEKASHSLQTQRVAPPYYTNTAALPAPSPDRGETSVVETGTKLITTVNTVSAKQTSPLRTFVPREVITDRDQSREVINDTSFGCDTTGTSGLDCEKRQQESPSRTPTTADSGNPSRDVFMRPVSQGHAASEGSQVMVTMPSYLGKPGLETVHLVSAAQTGASSEARSGDNCSPGVCRNSGAVASSHASSTSNVNSVIRTLLVSRQLDSSTRQVTFHKSSALPADRDCSDSASGGVSGEKQSSVTPTGPASHTGTAENMSPVKYRVISSGDQGQVTVSDVDRSSGSVPPGSVDEIEQCAVRDDTGVQLMGSNHGNVAADSTEEDSQLCCDSQKCGVTVIPGSHETLKKCCNAVVPKKRKRHMETKHMPFFWGSRKYARLRKLSSFGADSRVMYGKSNFSLTSKSGSGSIFIDVEPDSLMASSSSITKSSSSVPTAESKSKTSISVVREVSSQSQASGAQSRPKTVILQPGAIFSIPFSYTIPATSTSAPIPTVLPPSLAESQSVTSAQTGNQSSHSGSQLSSTTAGNRSPGEGLDSMLALAAEAGVCLDSSNTGFGDVTIMGRRRKYPTTKPFKCDVCSMSFNQRIHLKKHMSKHTGIKPYKCQQCDYSTVERSHLKVHIRIHTGEKPFKCTYCEYATAQNSTLKIHLKRHHGGRMFECGDCDKKFTQQEMLSSHETEHRNGDIDTTPTKPLAVQTEASAVSTNHSPGNCDLPAPDPS